MEQGFLSSEFHVLWPISYLLLYHYERCKIRTKSKEQNSNTIFSYCQIIIIIIILDRIFNDHLYDSKMQIKNVQVSRV